MRSAPLLAAMLVVLSGCSFPAAPQKPVPVTAAPIFHPVGVDQLPVRHLSSGLASDMRYPDRRVIATEEDWRLTWSLHQPTPRVVDDAGAKREWTRIRPDVDFARERVVALFGGEQLCTRVEVRSASLSRETALTMIAIDTIPLNPCPSLAVRSFDLVALPLDDSTILFQDAMSEARPAPLDEPPCGRLDVQTDRDQIRPGFDVNITARFQPCAGDAPPIIPACGGALIQGFARGAGQFEFPILLANGSDQPEDHSCEARSFGGRPQGEPAPVPGATMDRAWRWNATSGQVCGWISSPVWSHGGGLRDCMSRASAGKYEIGARIRIGNWTLAATRPLLVLPARVELPVLHIEETLHGATGPAGPACEQMGVGTDGLPLVRDGALALVERNLTTDNGTRLVTYVFFGGPIIMETPDGDAPLYRVWWLDGSLTVEGVSPPTQREARWSQAGHEIVDIVDARAAPPRLVEIGDVLMCMYVR